MQVTFREQWNDERLRYYDETKGVHFQGITLVLSFIRALLFCRPIKVPHFDGPNKGVDAGHILQERKRSPQTRDYSSKRVRENFSQWGNSL